MTIIVDIKPEVQAELSRQAAAHGVDIVAYAASLLQEAAQFPVGSNTLSASQLDKTLEELAQFSHRFRRFQMKPFHARVCIGITGPP
jgi:hypothetical protein